MTDPISEFQILFKKISDTGLPKAEAGFLATATKDGMPTGRVVLLKGVSDGKLLFFTNYSSQKGRDLSQNPRASMVFWWDSLGVQVRFEGDIEKSSSEISDSYWKSRPFDSNVSGTVSCQSEPISSYEKLVEEAESFKKNHSGGSIPRPPNWGGFLLNPKRIEFWFDKPNRLHLRKSYELKSDKWDLKILQP